MMLDKLKEIGRVIREYREKQGISQDDLAARLGVSVSTVSYYEAGARMPTLERILQIAKILQIPETLLLGFTEQTLDPTKDVDQTLNIALRSKGLDHDDIKSILGLVSSLSKTKNDEDPD